MKLFSLLLLSLFGLSLTATAADWPQWQGPNRNNINTEKGLLPSWPAGGPKELWRYPDCGIGYSSPSVVGDRLYLQGTRDKDEVIHCLDVKTGKPVWAKPTVIGSILDNNWGDGPRGSVTVDGDLLYGISGRGNLTCVEAATGKVVWKKGLGDDLGGGLPRWGYTESPLVDGEVVVCTPGGAQGSLAALNKKTGEVVWRSKGLTDGAAYASIIIVNFAGVKQYVQMTAAGLVGVEAKSGDLLWKERVAVNGIAIIPTPIYHDGHVYVTSDYKAGCALVKLDKADAGIKSKVVYENKIMENHHGGVVLIDGHIYGASGNGGGRPDWVCQELLTGKKVWNDNKFNEMGSLTAADGKLILYGQKTGLAALVEPSPAGYKELGRFTIPETSKIPRKSGLIWAHPVVANGKLYLRDLNLLYCYDVSGK